PDTTDKMWPKPFPSHNVQIPENVQFRALPHISNIIYETAAYNKKFFGKFVSLIQKKQKDPAGVSGRV
ncbi:MAG: hypothetical protein IJF79_01405, partial [Clostridia bacterium]|nr:hypothetical protein [Clostridia bacterium]